MVPIYFFPRLSAHFLAYSCEIRFEDPPPYDPSWPYGRRYFPEMLQKQDFLYLAGF